MQHPGSPVESLAALLEYPSASFGAQVEECRAVASRLKPEVAAGVERFADAVRGLSRSALQELYTQTFDLNAACTLDIGWHLFGEQYERGRFLSELRPQLAAAGIDEKGELPDYLPRLLLLLHRSDPTRTAELREMVRRAVEKIAGALHERRSPYEYLVTSAFAAASRGA
jgi:nitrate reductase molybdenum cofactor assembly chaperone